MDTPLKEKLNNLSLQFLLSKTMLKRNIDIHTKVYPSFLKCFGQAFSVRLSNLPSLSSSWRTFANNLGQERKQKNPNCKCTQSSYLL